MSLTVHDTKYNGYMLLHILTYFHVLLEMLIPVKCFKSVPGDYINRWTEFLLFGARNYVCKEQLKCDLVSATVPCTVLRPFVVTGSAAMVESKNCHGYD